MSSERLRRHTAVLFNRPPKTMVDDCTPWNRRRYQWSVSVCDGEQPFSSLFPLDIPRRSTLWVIILKLVKRRDSRLKRMSMLAYRRPCKTSLTDIECSPITSSLLDLRQTALCTTQSSFWQDCLQYLTPQRAHERQIFMNFYPHWIHTCFEIRLRCS